MIIAIETGSGLKDIYEDDCTGTAQLTEAGYIPWHMVNVCPVHQNLDGPCK